MSLPTDLDSLQEATESVTRLKASAVKNSTLVADTLQQVRLAKKDVDQLLLDSQSIVENIEDAYSAATTKGLGQAFQERADAIARTMWVWVGGLVTALIIGAILGAIRVSELQSALITNASSQIIWFNMIASVLAVAAPVWFAWIATKQIGHRFRLAEDYGFKASVAKAYEGYRREAARLDPSFAKKLFDSALTRLDEAPIRFVEVETYGSPWHEAIKLRMRRQGQEAVIREEKAAASALNEEDEQ